MKAHNYTPRQLRLRVKMRDPRWRAMAQKFWGLVQAAGPCDDGACWRASPRRKGDGYGVTNWGDSAHGSHVVAWMLYNGKKPQPGMEILHSCDRGWCVNPTHLSEGTHAENMQQKAARGRTGRATLTKERVHRMRQLRDLRYSYKELAAMYGVSISAAHSACTRATWKHVGDAL